MRLLINSTKVIGVIIHNIAREIFSMINIKITKIKNISISIRTICWWLDIKIV